MKKVKDELKLNLRVVESFKVMVNSQLNIKLGWIDKVLAQRIKQWRITTDDSPQQQMLRNHRREQQRKRHKHIANELVAQLEQLVSNELQVARSRLGLT